MLRSGGGRDVERYAEHVLGGEARVSEPHNGNVSWYAKAGLPDGIDGSRELFGAGEHQSARTVVCRILPVRMGD